MGGAHVFPGGRVDASDRLDDPAAVCDGVAHAIAQMPDVDAADAVAHHVAALRELFEEAGVLLARGRDRRLIAIGEDRRERFRTHRSAIAAGKTSLREVAEHEELRLALDVLTLFAHWVTPEIEIKRFDARFFLATPPEGQEPTPDEGETTESVWLDPRDAIEECRRGAIALPPPTWTTLRTLAAFSTVDDVTEWARQRKVVCVQPRLVRRGRVTLLTLPGDPLHPPLAGFDAPPDTRFVLENGRWRPVLP